MLDAGVCALWIEQSFQQAVRYGGCLKRLRQRYQLGDLSVEMKESSFLPLYFLPFGFILLSLFFYLLGTIFFICISWQHCLWFSCCLHKYAYIQDCQEKERKKKMLRNKLNWACLFSQFCSMLSCFWKFSSSSVFLSSHFPCLVLLMEAPVCVCFMCACACMQVECATCNVLLHSSVNVLAWLQRYLVYSYYFYYCGCLVKPDIITAVMLFNCIEEQCS